MDITALAVAVSATTGLVQVLRMATNLKSRFIPLLAYAVGILMTFVFTHSFAWTTLAIGILTGTSASGIYSGIKTLANPATPNQQS